jgi:glycosyltransferase involved in cell wall biosynthesis
LCGLPFESFAMPIPDDTSKAVSLVPSPVGGRVSVVVATFNRAKYIEECITSILDQDIAPHQVIVVDDGSDDGTAELLAKFEGRILYLWKPNGGKSSALNKALPLVTGDWVWILDDDDVALPDAIKHRLSTQLQFPDADFVYSPHFLGHDGPKGRIKVDHLYTPPVVDERSFLLRLLKGCFFHLGSTLIRFSLLEMVGPFDERLHRSQDYDMQIRLAHFGRPAFCPAPSFVFRQHDGARGPRAARHDGQARVANFHTYNQLVGKKVRLELQLGEYLDSARYLTSGDETCRALASRMVVMAQFGCLTDMFKDLHSILHLHRHDSNLDGELLQQIQELLCFKHSWLALRSASPRTFRYLRLVARHPAGRSVYFRIGQSVAKRLRWGPTGVIDLVYGIGLFFSMAIWAATVPRVKKSRTPAPQ